MDYVGEAAAKTRALLAREFDGAAVCAGDPERVPAAGRGGTFGVEIASSAVETTAEDYGRVVATLRIWTYVDGDGPAAAEVVTALAQRLEAALFAAGLPAGGGGALGLETQYLRTDYLTREKGRAFRRRRVRAARTEWRVRLAARR